MPKIVCFIANKGGVGKTCNATGLAQALVFLGKTCLAADFENNNNLTDITVTGHPDFSNIGKRNLNTALVGAHSISEVIWKDNPHGFDVIPTIGRVQDFDYLLFRDPSLGIRIGQELRSLPYDFVILDVNPIMNNTMRFALEYADLAIAPLEDDTQNLEGIDKIFEWAKSLSFKVPIRILRNNITKAKQDFQMELIAATNSSLKTLETVIYSNPGIKNAKNLKTPLSPKSEAFNNFVELAKEVLNEIK
ncbi:ParA family protein [Leptospira sp. 201903071]|uniref:ParA family protein n=1 Tax=Leptospira ainazelensis TaxID=2810034 RepID=UPI001962440F|nr:ParA family protein [Leptospira ainazelensis]MBM9499698.1 ParA family protein [Leptospira ainazelensis]